MVKIGLNLVHVIIECPLKLVSSFAYSLVSKYTYTFIKKKRRKSWVDIKECKRSKNLLTNKMALTVTLDKHHIKSQHQYFWNQPHCSPINSRSDLMTYFDTFSGNQRFYDDHDWFEYWLFWIDSQFLELFTKQLWRLPFTGCPNNLDFTLTYSKFQRREDAT